VEARRPDPRPGVPYKAKSVQGQSPVFPVTDFGNKFISRIINNLPPISHLADPAFCATVFYPEFANEYYRQKSDR